MPTHEILGISGSLRAGSFNTSLLQAAQRWAPAAVDMDVHIYDALGLIPPFDPDRNAPTPPSEVARLRERIQSADGVLIATPEYNYGIPGVLKNALDWASIPTPPTREASLAHKLIAIMGASPSPFGTVRAQLALRQLFLCTDSRVVTKPEVHVFNAFRSINDRGEVTDHVTKGFVIQLLESLRRTIDDGFVLEREVRSDQLDIERQSA